MLDTHNENRESSIEMLFTYTETTEYLLQYLLIDVTACGGFDAGNGLVSGPQHHCGNLIIAGS